MRRPRSYAAAWVGLSALVTVAWAAVALNDGRPAPVDTDPRGAAAAAATAALLAAGWRPNGLEAFRLGGLGLGVLPLAVAGTARSTALLAAALAAAAVASAVTGLSRQVRRHAHARARRDGASIALGAGCALVAAGLVANRAAAGRWRLPGPDADETVLAAALLGAALVVAAAQQVSRGWPLVVPALLAALGAARGVDVLPLAAAAGVLGAAAAARAWPPAPALAAMAVGAAALPATQAAAVLLASAAALAPVVAGAGAALGVPGVAAAAATLAAGDAGWQGLALGAAVSVTATLLARSALAARGAAWSRPEPAAAPALVFAAWLLLAPGTWDWAGAGLLAPYDRGAAVAAAAGALAVLTGGWQPRSVPAPVPAPAPAPAPDPPAPAQPPARRRRRPPPVAAEAPG